MAEASAISERIGADSDTWISFLREMDAAGVKMVEITATVKIPILGGGGSFTYDDCARYLMAGCGLSGLCSSLYSRGVGILEQCIDGMNDYMDRKGYQTIGNFQGCEVKEFKYLREWNRENPMADLTPIIPVFYEEKCDGCGWCVGHCKPNAIKCIDTETGDVMWDGFSTIADWVTD